MKSYRLSGKSTARIVSVLCPGAGSGRQGACGCAREDQCVSGHVIVCVCVESLNPSLCLLADRDMLCTHVPARGSMEPLSPSAGFYSKRLSELGSGEPRRGRPGRQPAQLSPDNVPLPAM